MSAIRNPERHDRWLTIAAAIALAYAVGLIVFGIRAQQSPAHWIGRIGSIAVIVGVLAHQRRVGVTAHTMIGGMLPRLGAMLIVAGIAAIVAGFTMGVVGF